MLSSLIGFSGSPARVDGLQSGMDVGRRRLRCFKRQRLTCFCNSGIKTGRRVSPNKHHHIIEGSDALSGRRGNRYTNRLSRLQVDKKLKFRGLLNRQIGGVCSFEDPEGLAGSAGSHSAIAERYRDRAIHMSGDQDANAS